MKENGRILEGVVGKEKHDSSDTFIGEGYNLGSPTNIPGFKQTTNFHPSYAKDGTIDFNTGKKKKKKRIISTFFSDLSRLGMNYEDKVIDNMSAIPGDKAYIPKDKQLPNDIFSQLLSNWKVKDNKDKGFFEKDFPLKREALRKLALQPELEDILDTMTNECIVYDSNYTYFMEPYIDGRNMSDFDNTTKDKINDELHKGFRKIYKMLDWRTRAWDDFKRFLVEGILAWEIVYDDLENPTNIIGLVPLDAATLTKKFENNKWYWIQYKDVHGKERKLMDAQIIYIAYQESNIVSRLSYLERLIRPFNIYRIIEQAQIIWTVTNSSYKMKFTIPVKNMNKPMGAQTLMSAMNRYKEDIKFISDTGELSINGQVNMPFNTEYWMPETSDGTPEIEVLGGEGPELNDNDQLKFFKNQLYKISKIPLNRFDAESGETWFGVDAASVARTEIDFARFVNRLRNTFSQIMLKPIQNYLCLKIPELLANRDFLNSIQLQYTSYNPFEEMMEIELMQKRIDFISSAKESMIDMDIEGNEIKFFSSEFLIKKYLKLSESDLKLNNKMKEEEIKKLNLAGVPDNDGSDMESYSIDDNQKMLLEKKLKNKEDIEVVIRKRKKNKIKIEYDDEKIIDKEEE